MPTLPGGTFPWYAVVIKDRGAVKATVLTALEWQADQTPGPEGATFQVLGGYDTKAEAQKAVSDFNALPNPQKLAKAGVTTAPDLPNPLKGVDAIGDFFQRLTQAATWERVGEVLLGGILVYAGVKALSSGTVAGKVGKTAASPVKKASKAAAGVTVPEVKLAAKVGAKRAAPKTTARIASHRAAVKRPPPRQTATRVSHIYHHKVKP